MTLVEFLEARLADDEQPTWELVPYECEPGCCAPAGYVGHRCLICRDTSFGGTVEAITAIAEEHDESIHRRARVLAECAAKRKVIDLHRMALGDGTEFKRGGFWEQVQVVGCVNCTVCSITGDVCIIEGPCETLLALAAPYASHEQFDPAWLPEVQVETGGGLGDH